MCLFSNACRKMFGFTAVFFGFQNGKHKPDGPIWCHKIKEINGVDVEDATSYEFQRLFKCTKAKFIPCRDLFFPERCSSSPCNQC